MTKRLLVFGAAVMIPLLALVVLWQFRMIGIYVLVSVALAAAIRPLVQGLAKRGKALRLALILLCLVVVCSFGALLFLGGLFATREIQRLAQAVSVHDEWRLPVWLKGRSFELALTTRLPSPGDIFKGFTGDQGQLVLPTMLGFTQEIADILSGIAIVVVLSAYWSMSAIHFERLWFSLLPPAQRKLVHDTWHTIEADIGVYIRGQVVQSLLAALLFGLGYWLLGSPYATLLALIGALGYLIPVVGPALVVVPPLLVGLLTGGQVSLLTSLYAIIVLIALGGWVKPRLFNCRWDNPILTVLLLIALADAFGFVGIIIAPPLSIVCQILWGTLISQRAAAGATVWISDLKKRQAAVLAAIAAMDEPSLPLVLNSIERLNRLLEQAEPILQAALPAEPSEPSRISQPMTTGGGAPAATTR